jgi:hypothetical protein
MIEIAGGIILAVLFFVFLPYILAAASIGIVLFVAVVVIALVVAFASQFSTHDALALASAILIVGGCGFLFHRFPRILVVVFWLLVAGVAAALVVGVAAAAFNQKWLAVVCVALVAGLLGVGVTAIVRAERRRALEEANR